MEPLTQLGEETVLLKNFVGEILKIALVVLSFFFFFWKVNFDR